MNAAPRSRCADVVQFLGKPTKAAGPTAAVSAEADDKRAEPPALGEYRTGS